MARGGRGPGGALRLDAENDITAPMALHLLPPAPHSRPWSRRVRAGRWGFASFSLPGPCLPTLHGSQPGVLAPTAGCSRASVESPAGKLRDASDWHSGRPVVCP